MNLPPGRAGAGRWGIVARIAVAVILLTLAIRAQRLPKPDRRPGRRAPVGLLSAAVPAYQYGPVPAVFSLVLARSGGGGPVPVSRRAAVGVHRRSLQFHHPSRQSASIFMRASYLAASTESARSARSSVADHRPDRRATRSLLAGVRFRRDGLVDASNPSAGDRRLDLAVVVRGSCSSPSVPRFIGRFPDSPSGDGGWPALWPN